MFDQQYQAYLNNEHEKGGNYHSGIQTEIKNRQPIDESKKGYYHTPFEGINLDEKVEGITKGAKK